MSSADLRCPRCGAPIPPNTWACGYCGATLEPPARTPKPPRIPAAGADVARILETVARARAARPPAAKTRGCGCLMTLVPILVLVAGGLVFMLGHPLPTPDLLAPAPWIRMCGSSTLGSSLAPRLALAFVKKMGGADAALAVDKNRSQATVTATVASQRISVVVDYSGGSGSAFDGLSNGNCDVGLASRAITAAEASRLSTLGDLRSPAAEHVVGMDGIAVIVNPAIALERLKVERLAEVFLGSITDWSRLGAPPGSIHPYSRDKTSGTYDAFVQGALGGRDIPTGRAQVVADNDAVTSAVARDVLGIGFVGLPFIGKNRPLALQAGDALAVAPSVFSVASEDYPLSRRLYMYTRPSGAPTQVGQFLDFVLSDEGQRTVSDTGFVSLGATTSTSPLPPEAPAPLARALGQARRLSFTFRFRPGTATLDSRGLGDVGRLASTIRTSGGQLLLVGFADKTGSEPANVILSKQRAQSVAEAVRKDSVQPVFIEGFGSTLPVAPNDTEEGRERNRRVEAWVR